MDNYHEQSDDEEAGIISSDRRKARLPRRGIGIRHRVGDESEEALIGGNDVEDEVTPEEKKEADGLVIRNVAVNLCFISLWYVCL